MIKATSCAICGSDLHLMDGMMPTMEAGDVLGHAFMGEVVEAGSAITKFRRGDRIVVPFNINCGECTDLADGPGLHETFKQKRDGCVKVVFHPG